VLNLRTWSRRRPLLALIILILLLGGGYAVRAFHHTGGGPARTTNTSISASGAAGQPGTSAPHGSAASHGSTALSRLPVQAQTTVRLIQQRGPFPYRSDGIVYNNLERRLPIKPRGYYHEYTVSTPGSADRGARRIITGGDGEFYYTSDHYDSFVHVDVTG
jgi:guanyl-specific ribonuclease Sa